MGYPAKSLDGAGFLFYKYRKIYPKRIVLKEKKKREKNKKKGTCSLCPEHIFQEERNKALAF